jgi:hypothetical protein
VDVAWPAHQNSAGTSSFAPPLLPAPVAFFIWAEQPSNSIGRIFLWWRQATTAGRKHPPGSITASPAKESKVKLGVLST